MGIDEFDPNPKGNCRHLGTLPKKLSDQGRVVTTDLKMRAPLKPEHITYSILVMSDSYMGLDVESKFSIKVIPEQELPAYEVHPEDAELDEQPSLFAIQTEKDIFEDSDSEEDDEDDEDGKEFPTKKPTRRRMNQRMMLMVC